MTTHGANVEGGGHQAWSAILSQITSPLAYFALQLLVSESSLSYCLGRYSGSERVVMYVASLMAFSFLVSFGGVLFLTYKVPRNTLMQLERAAIEEARFRGAMKFLLKRYGGKKLGQSEILDLVDGVLLILKDGSEVFGEAREKTKAS